MNFNQIELDVFRRCSYADSPASAVKTRIDGFINQRHRQLLSMPGVSRLRDDQLSFSTTASVRYYALGPVVSRVKAIFDGTTNQLKLTERTLQWVRTVDPRNSAPGTPETWIPISRKQVQTQPAAACDLHVVSSNAGDTTQTVYVEYTRSGGYHGSASHLLNGTSDVALTTTGDVIEVDKFYISATAAGAVTLLDASGGNVLATIAIGYQSCIVQWIQLWPMPSSTWTYQVDYTREIFDMTNASDEPLLPPDFHYLLSVGARIDEYEKMQDERLPIVQREWDQGVGRLKEYVTNNPDFLIVPGGTSRVNWSNLGPFYPSGSWWD